MHTYRFRASRATLSAHDLRALRSVCSLSINELQSRARAGEAILEFEPVSSRVTLEALCSAIEAGSLPLHIFDRSVFPGLEPADERLSTEQFRARLQTLREIATQTAIATELEAGYIQTPSEYFDHRNESDRNA